MKTKTSCGRQIQTDLKSQRTLVKVKFRRKLLEQFGKRSFHEKTVAANMTSVVILSQRNKLSFVSAQISVPYFDGNGESGDEQTSPY